MSAMNEGEAGGAAVGSDFLQLDVRDAPDGGKADWLAGRLRQAMADGRLAVGSRLPPTRVLAAELRVSRGVVTEAYRRLAEEGHLQGRRRGGTVVVAAPVAQPPAAPPAGPSAAPPVVHPPEPGALFAGEPGAAVFDALRAAPARAVLLTPAHQFPTGVVTGGGRRRELLRWAVDGGLILEDDYDAEHRYDRPPVPALRALLADRVCYMGSVSKLLAPALRTGWMVPPPRHRDALTEAKRFTDLGNAVLPQLVLAHLMESGDLERHLRLLRGRHRRRRDAMIGALAAHLPGAVVHGAAAGLHLTVTYPHDVPDTALAAAALARGVKCQPLSWHRQRAGRPGLVLGYAATPPGVIAEGVTALGEALRDLA
ncbi:PLP-dependent aminotransferase family protein [Streptomyces sp. NPDC006134]|uniref:aminotransferase-like domain-containing protein n=1 Tax=Streptomyces sp. NPDC006134 TaxID=3154467 RepID=UPI0033FC50AE